MKRRVVVLRPEPGNGATVAALRRAGLPAIALPLFEVSPIAWACPSRDAHDGLLLTSANAVRCAGPGLVRLSGLPVFAVGAATEREARHAGLQVIATGRSGVAAIVMRAKTLGYGSLLHLAGRDREPTPPGVTAVATVYESRALDIDPNALSVIEDGVALLYSPRAARRLSFIAGRIDRGSVRLVALSPAVAAAAGDGWAKVEVAASRDDHAMVALARRLAD